MAFNPDTFIHQTVTGETSTKYVPCPKGRYAAIIPAGGLTFNSGQRDDGEEWIMAAVQFSIEDDKVKEVMGRDEVRVRYSFFLDVETLPDGTMSLKHGEGVNVPLGRLRAALDLNAGDFVWTDLYAKPACITVDHEVNKKTQEIVGNVKFVEPYSALA